MKNAPNRWFCFNLAVEAGSTSLLEQVTMLENTCCYMVYGECSAEIDENCSLNCWGKHLHFLVKSCLPMTTDTFKQVNDLYQGLRLDTIRIMECYSLDRAVDKYEGLVLAKKNVKVYGSKTGEGPIRARKLPHTVAEAVSTTVDPVPEWDLSWELDEDTQEYCLQPKTKDAQTQTEPMELTSKTLRFSFVLNGDTLHCNTLDQFL